MNNERRWLGAIVGITLSVVAMPATAIAQSSSPMSNEMRSDYLFRSGEKKFDSGQYAEACADFEESLHLGPKLGTLLNLALCHETIGKAATAWKEFHHAAAWAAQNNQKDRHAFAIDHAIALETKLPRVRLELPAGTAIAGVEVDGEPIPDSGWYLPLYLDAGEHAVGVTAPGKQRTTVKFRVIGTGTEQIVSVPPLADELPPAPKKLVMIEHDPDRTRRLVGVIALGASAAGLAAGTTFGVVAIGARDDASCAGNRCDEAGASSYRDAQRWARLSTISFVATAVFAGAGAYLLLTSAPKRMVPAASATPLGVTF